MRTGSLRYGTVWVVLLVCLGCTGNSNLANRFGANSGGGPFAGGPFAGSLGTTASVQVREMEKWQQHAASEYQRMEAQLAGLTRRNETLEAQITNAQRHAQLQDQHLADISRRLKQSTAELGQYRSREQQSQSQHSSLDDANQQKNRQLAAARRDVQRLEAQLVRLERELQNKQDQLARARQEQAEAKQTADTLLAASRRRGNASITPNSNISLAEIDIPGVDIRRDGEVLRVPLSSDELFPPGTVQLRPAGADLLRRVSAEISRAFPDQRIGVEGHTDDSTISGPWRDHLHLSSAQAMAAYEWMARQGLFLAKQLHVVGHGANHPLYSSATAEGRRGNRRLELVIYPEAVPSQ
ncbi:MAG: OmpA family protein [Planctomycetales bacterium]|nr:OmpA family protein [Planctomycetales bacterium]NIM09762.1 OmpA family protein [Planctomycetales bacterium]NIN09231.1 OmpA family protein [Planctomycetales bacterium]NIN78331.1 OmpA family protein [Planctomycetales bacterium]NIO35510.1 OmpA family protein [Planctomycetales bacterium]